MRRRRNPCHRRLDRGPSRTRTDSCRRHTDRVKGSTALMSAMPTLQIIVASTRPGRVGLPVADWVTARAEAHGAFEVDVVDLAELGLPLYGRAQPPASAPLRAPAHEGLERPRPGCRRFRVRHPRVQPQLQRAAEERDRLPARRVGVQAGRFRLLRRDRGRDARAAGAQAGGHRAQDDAGDRGRERPVRAPVHQRRRGLRAQRGARAGRRRDARRARPRWRPRCARCGRR